MDLRNLLPLNWCVFVGGALIAHLLLSEAPSYADELNALDGNVAQGEVASIDVTGNVMLAGDEKSIKLNALRSIVRSVKPSPADEPEHEVTLTLAQGGQLLAADVVLADDVFSLTTAFGTLEILIDDVRAVRFDSQSAHAGFTRALQNPDDEFDRFMALVDDEMTTIRGFVESMSQTTVSFERDGQSQSLSRSKAYGIVLAAIDSDRGTRAPCEVQLWDGSTVSGQVIGLQKDSDKHMMLSLDIGESELKLPWRAVQTVRVRSDRVQYLADMDPVDVLEQPVVALPRAWKRNRNVLGQPLQIGSRTFASGIGVQSRSVLTFAADEKYQRLTAVIGIDASTKGRGDCEFVIRADGRELLRQRMTGKDEGKKITVSLAGARRVQLIVEPGANLDFGDHANWCDVSFVR